jgi:site-specific recombinase XerD
LVKQAHELYNQGEEFGENQSLLQARGAPTTANATVARQWLTEAEVEQLMGSARKRGRYGHRDSAMILMAYRHGLRVSQLVSLKWEQVDMVAGRLQVIRLKGSDDSVQPLAGVELRALRRLQREGSGGPRYVFVSERGCQPMTAQIFRKMLRRAADAIGMVGVHPHLLRHGCGFRLVNMGVDTRTLAAYLGHRQLNNTSRYTKMDSRRFNHFWED